MQFLEMLQMAEELDLEMVTELKFLIEEKISNVY
jgi:hypothetical protein